MRTPRAVAAALLASGLLAAAAAGAELPEPEARRIFEAAVADYEAGAHARAEAQLGELVRGGHATVPVLFNLGNAAYRQRRWPVAVLAYEWALSLDPRDEEARDNLALARRHLVVDEVPLDLGPGAVRTLEILAMVPARATAAVFLVPWTLGWLLLARRFLAGREVATWPAVLLVLASLVFAAHVAWQVHAARSGPRGVLQAAEVEVRSGPGASYQTLFTLHAGTLVQRLEGRGGWSRVRVPHGPGGWIEDAQVALIGHPETLPSPSGG